MEAAAFKPVGTSPAFVPGARPDAAKNTAAQAPAPKPSPKPKKEAAVLALEKLAGQEEGDSGDAAPSAPLVETYNLIKSAKKVTSELLRRFLGNVGGLKAVLPPVLVEVSVCRRVLARGDEGKFKPLPESGNQKGRPRYPRTQGGGQYPGNGDGGGYAKNKYPDRDRQNQHNRPDRPYKRPEPLDDWGK